MNRTICSIAIITVCMSGVFPRPCLAQELSAVARESLVNPLTAELPPSSVSPAIAKFMRQHADDLPPPSSKSAMPSPVSRRIQTSIVADEVRQDDQVAPEFPRPIVPRRIGAFVDDENPLATGLALKSAPYAATDVRLPINLATALRLADARPLIVSAAQASVWVAEANLSRSKVLWIPMLTLGFDYTRHDGGGPDFNSGVLKNQDVNFFYGGGGLIGVITTSDAIFKPLINRQVLNARHSQVQTSKNDVLYKTAEAYFRVHEARGLYAGALYTVERGRELIDQVQDLSRDLVPRFEVDRARNLVADLEQRAASARQEWRVQSANLTQTLRLDPRAIVEPLEHDHAQITLIDPGRSLDDLMPIAVMNRPELAAHRAIVKAAEIAVRHEKARPFLPQVILNGFQTASASTNTDASMDVPTLGVLPESRLVEGEPGASATAGVLQFGAFGIGNGSNLNQWTTRDDFSVQLMWQVEDLGFGNRARIKVQRGNQSKQIIELRKMQDTVVAEVTRASAHVQLAAARVLQADRALRTGIITFNGNLEGLKQTKRLGNVLILVNRPEEVVYSLDLLYTAFSEYISTVADYNMAQFELFHAIGCPANELARLCLPGDQLPVDLDRPTFLPYVQNGPPPATR